MQNADRLLPLWCLHAERSDMTPALEQRRQVVLENAIANLA